MYTNFINNSQTLCIYVYLYIFGFLIKMDCDLSAVCGLRLSVDVATNWHSPSSTLTHPS